MYLPGPAPLTVFGYCTTTMGVFFEVDLISGMLGTLDMNIDENTPIWSIIPG